MKTSNSICCAVVVAVLGLSVALSVPHAFAAELDYKVYPAAMCGRVGDSGANISRNVFGGIQNLNPALTLFVSCPVPNNVSLQITGLSFMQTTDRNPGPSSVHNIICNLVQVTRLFEESGVVLRRTAANTSGESNNLQNLLFGPPDPTNVTGAFSNNFFQCVIPAQPAAGAFSELHSYGVAETTPGGVLQAMLPPDAQARHARAAVEAQEMRVTQALTAEKEDPEWSQRAVTSWTQVFQDEGIKEELKGIQLRKIECRTTLCRVELAPTDSVQGAVAFEQGVDYLMLFAPWQGSSFGMIRNPAGQAPVAVLYMAREGHILP